MALIDCIECGKRFSDKAPACPACACPTADVLSMLDRGMARDALELYKVNSDERQGSDVRSVSVAEQPSAQISTNDIIKGLPPCGYDDLLESTFAPNGDGAFRRSKHAHRRAVTSVRFSPDGQWFASSSRDGTIKLWRSSDGHYIRTLRSTKAPVIVSKTERTIANLIGTILLPFHSLLGDMSEGVSSIDISPDGQTIAAARGGGGNVVLVDVQSGAIRHTLEAASSSPISFSPDGTLLVTCTRSYDEDVEHGLIIWRVEDGQQLNEWSGHSDFVRCVQFSPDGRIIACGYSDDSIRLYNAEDGRIVKTMKGHSERVNALAFSNDGQTLISGASDKTVRTWSVHDGTQLDILKGHESEVTTVACSPIEDLFVSSSGRVLWEHKSARLWKLGGQEQICVLENLRVSDTFLCFSPDGQNILTGSRDKTLRVWTLDGKCRLKVGPTLLSTLVSSLKVGSGMVSFGLGMLAPYLLVAGAFWLFLTCNEPPN